MWGSKQFLLWTFAEREGKQVKMPISPINLKPCNAHEPANWVTLDKAQALATTCNMGVAFVFTENDPYFFLDIDECAVDGGWSDTAKDLMTRLQGAYLEVSQSGTGLHIIGRYTAIDAHGCKNGPLDIELYHTSRFCALTFGQASGDPEVDCTAALASIIPYYFPSVASSTGGTGEWSDVPVSEWSGPNDDDDLIDLMRHSRQSFRSLLGATASFSQLWDADIDAMGKCYPDPSGERPYDSSSADMALAMHLAFWTGKNHDRIYRLMFMSALRREKWEKRKDYLTRTIRIACAKQSSVYSGRSDAETGVKMLREADTVSGYQFLSPTQQVEHFKGCIYVRDLHKIYVPDGSLLKPDQFKVMYGGYVFALDSINEKTTKNAWETFSESQAVRFPKVSCVCFRPEHESGEIISEEGRELLNVWVPVEVPRAKGDASRFLDHLSAMLPNERDREILLSYMAAIVQYPGYKFQWAPLLQGCEGNGKTLFIRCVSEAVGHRYTHLPNAADLGGNGGKFNSWIQNKLFIGVEEIYVGNRREIADALKPLITNSRIEIQGKGENQYTGDNRANFILCTNHKDAIKKTANDRRYCILYTAQQSKEDMIRCGWINAETGENTRYFPDLYNWLREEGYPIVTDYLASYQIKDEFNPATSCQRAPISSCHDEAVRLTMGPAEQEILECVDEGLPGFANGWISSAALEKRLNERNMAKRLPPTKRKEVLENLGYIPHPGLRDGRVNNIIMVEGCKPRLYVKKGHLACNIEGCAEIVRQYMLAQGYQGLTPPVTDAIVSNK